MSPIDRGSKSPTFELAGRTWPSSYTTLSSGTSQIPAARRQSSLITVRALFTTTIPTEYVVRLPAVTRLNPSELVSEKETRTLSTGMPSSSAAIMAMEIREPATSAVPITTVTVPSGAKVNDPAVSPPRLNQKPVDIPLPSPSLTGDL